MRAVSIFLTALALLGCSNDVLAADHIDEAKGGKPGKPACYEGYTTTVNPHAISKTVGDGSGSASMVAVSPCGFTVPNVKATWTVRNTAVVAAVSSIATNVSFTPVGEGTTYVVVSSDGGGLDSLLFTVSAAEFSCTSTATNLCPGDDLNAAAQAAANGTAFTLGSGTFVMQSITPKTNQSFTGQGITTVLTGARTLTGWTLLSGSNYYVTGQTQNNTSYGNYVCATAPVARPMCFQPEELWVNGHRYEPEDVIGEMGAGEWFFDYAADRIYLPFNPADSTVLTSVTVQAFKGSATGVVIQNMVVERYANGAQSGAINAGSTGWQIIGVEARYNHGIGIRGGGSSLLRRNYVHHNGQMGMSAAGLNVVVDTNEISYNNVSGFGRGSQVELGGTKFVSTTNLMVRGNFVHHNFGPGLWTDINNTACTYDGNTVEDNEWKGIIHEISYSCVIKNNIARRNGFIYDGPRSACDGAGIMVVNSRDVEVFGNTIEDNRAGICAEETQRAGGSPSYDLINFNVHDNTIKQTDAGIAGGSTDADPNADPFGVAANNKYLNNTYQLGASTRFLWQLGQRTWTIWRTTYSQDPGSTQTGQ